MQWRRRKHLCSLVLGCNGEANARGSEDTGSVLRWIGTWATRNMQVLAADPSTRRHLHSHNTRHLWPVITGNGRLCRPDTRGDCSS